MKRFVAVIVVVLVVAGCAGEQAVEASRNIRSHHHGEFDEVVYGGAGSRLWYETTLEGLENRAPNIVRARMMDDAYMQLQFSEVSGRLIIGNNLVSIEIIEVIKGNLTEGEIIRIGEPYFIYQGTLYALHEYLPSIPGQEYIFFLYHQIRESGIPEHIGVFSVLHEERSRYPIPFGRGHESIMDYLDEDSRFCATIQDFSSAVFGLGSYANVDIYMQLWEDVMNAYVLPRLQD